MLFIRGYFSTQNLLSDAEIPKYISQDFVGGDFADDASEVVDGFADVLGGEVGGEAGGETVADAEQGSAGVGEGLDVALVGDEGGVAVAEEVALCGGEVVFEVRYACLGLCSINVTS